LPTSVAAGYDRLVFAAQVTTVEFVGRFLRDPLDVPAVVLDCLAEQLGISHASHRWLPSPSWSWRSDQATGTDPACYRFAQHNSAPGRRQRA
jgi:hypothetical protein